MNLFSFFQQPLAQRLEVDHMAPGSAQGGARQVVVVRQRKIETEPIKQDEGNLKTSHSSRSPLCKGRGRDLVAPTLPIEASLRQRRLPANVLARVVA
jgi:hypothetical protein